MTSRRKSRGAVRWVMRAGLLLLLWLLASDAAAQQTRRPWLGVVLSKPDAQGVPITEVVAGSPAEAARLAVGDHIVLVDGKAVTTPKEVIEAVGQHQPGQMTRLEIVRQGKRYQTAAKLTAMPSGEELLRRQRAGKPAPAFVGLASIDGGAVPSLDALRGKVVVVDFWAPWCVACRFSIPHLNGWSSQYKAKGLSIVGVGTDETSSIAAGVRAWGIRYPVAADPDMKTWTAYGAREAPSLLVIDRRGVVRDVATGFDPIRMRELEALIERLLLEPAS